MQVVRAISWSPQRNVPTRRILAASLLTAVAWLGGCGSDEPDEPRDPFFTEAEWAQIRELSPLPELPPDPTNRFADDRRAALLGQKFFFDPRFSGPLVHRDNERPGGNGRVGETGKVSCATCHDPAAAFIDPREGLNDVSLGSAWGRRNTPTALNAAYFDFLFWDGRADSLWLQSLRPLDDHAEHNISRLARAHVVWRHYKAEYEAVFGAMPNLADTGRFPLDGSPAFAEQGLPASPSWTGMTAADQDAVNRVAVNWGKAVAAYQRRLVSGDSKFDRYVAGDHALFNEGEKRGLRVFLGNGNCIACHSGPLFSDGIFHNLGIAQTAGAHVPAEDLGAAAALPNLLEDPFNAAGPYSDDRVAGQAKLDRRKTLGIIPGQFRTPSLRNVLLTPPFFHNGSRTGRDSVTGVIEFYRVGGDPQGTFVGLRDELIVPLDDFTPTNAFDLQEFLRTLESAPLDPSLTRAPTLP
jgi:cytochrome c peroxidase